MKKNSKMPDQIPLWKWAIGILFPFYGLYLLFSKTRFRWFVKLIILVFTALVSIVAIDTVLNPHRVEETVAQKEIKRFIQASGDIDFGRFRKAEREGVFLWNDEPHVVYRILTDVGEFDFVLIADGKENLKTEAVYQTYPTDEWLKKSTLPLPPDAMIITEQLQAEVGEIESAENMEDEHEWVIKTDKGTFQLMFLEGQLVEILDETGSAVFKRERLYALPKKAESYLQKHEKKHGKIEAVFGYDMDPVKESYHVQTDKGLFRVDVYDNGKIELLEAKILE